MFARITCPGSSALLAIAALACSAVPAQLGAQTATGQQRTVTVTYRKVASGKGSEQRKFAETTWKKFYQSLVDDGRAHGYMIMRLTAPFATGASADWAIVSFLNKPPSVAPLDTTAAEAAARKAGLANLQAFVDQSNALSTAVRSEWLTTSARVGTVTAGNYMRGVRMMVPADKRAAVNDWMRDVTMPLQRQAIQAGRYAAWGVSAPAGLTGGSDEAGYSHSTTQIVKDAHGFDAGPYGVTEARLKEVFGGKMNMGQYYNRQNQVFEGTKTVSTRIWEIVAVVGKVPEITPN